MWTGVTWARMMLLFPGKLGTVPSVEISARLKTTAGYCFWELRKTQYSWELLAEYPEAFRREIIPHELSHQANWDMFRPEGNGCHDTNFRRIMQRLGLPGDTTHDMVNTKHAMRRAKIKV